MEGDREPEDCTRPGGCLALISSGQGEAPSILYGDERRRRTTSSSTPRRSWSARTSRAAPRSMTPGSVAGIPEPAAPAPCQGDACQGQGSEPPALPGPATTGGGEERAEPKPQRCAQRQAPRQRPLREAPQHKKHHKHQRRANAQPEGRDDDPPRSDSARCRRPGRSSRWPSRRGARDRRRLRNRAAPGLLRDRIGRTPRSRPPRRAPTPTSRLDVAVKQDPASPTNVFGLHNSYAPPATSASTSRRG